MRPGLDSRPRATAPLMGAIGCLSSVSPSGRPMLIANTSPAWQVWMPTGLGSYTRMRQQVCLPPPTPRGSYVNIDGHVRAMVEGDIR